MGWMAHRKWKEAKQLPGTAGPGNMLGCCLIFFHFLWADVIYGWPLRQNTSSVKIDPVLFPILCLEKVELRYKSNISLRGLSRGSTSFEYSFYLPQQ